MRGVRINIEDAMLMSYARNRGGGQISLTVRRCIYACFLVSEPRLQEPIYKVTIQCQNDVSQLVGRCLAKRRSVILSEEPIVGTTLVLITAYLPVAESLDLTQALKTETSGSSEIIVTYC